MTNFRVLTTTWTTNSESFVLSLFFKSIRTILVIEYFAYRIQHKQDGNALKHVALRIAQANSLK